MKNLFIVLALGLFSCSSDGSGETQPDATCYDIIARGEDLRGDYIIIKYGNFNNKRYSVADFMEYLDQQKLCEPINLIEQPL
jgi:hypothetical protein